MVTWNNSTGLQCLDLVNWNNSTGIQCLDLETWNGDLEQLYWNPMFRPGRPGMRKRENVIVKEIASK